ncbi:MAG: hypothetical protein PVG45_10105, partial [Gammaproteobacteria bacterium]
MSGKGICHRISSCITHAIAKHKCFKYGDHNMITHFNRFLLMLLASLGISLSLISNSYALGLTSSTSTFSWKSVGTNALVCKADEGEISIDANPTGGGIFNEEGHDIQFLMESSTYIDETTGVPTVKTKSHTCYEVPADANGQPTITFEDCESGNYSDSDCKVGEFTLDQKVEDLDGGDGVLSNCLQFNQSGGLETYRCQVSNGAP